MAEKKHPVGILLSICPMVGWCTCQ